MLIFRFLANENKLCFQTKIHFLTDLQFLYNSSLYNMFRPTETHQYSLNFSEKKNYIAQLEISVNIHSG